MSKKVNWKNLYKGFEANVTNFDCGTLCAPDNDGIPVCCDVHLQPVLFVKELKWLEEKSSQWKKKTATTKQEKREANEIADHICYAGCRGVEKCDRRFRALVCRFFPLEPYFDGKKRFRGLTYNYAAEGYCPVINNGEVSINPDFVEQSIKVWLEIFGAYPEEVECYIQESKKLRKKFKEKHRKIRIFRERGEQA